MIFYSPVFLIPVVISPYQLFVDGVPDRGVCSCGKTLLVTTDLYNGPRRFRCPDPVSTGCAY